MLSRITALIVALAFTLSGCFLTSNGFVVLTFDEDMKAVWKIVNFQDFLGCTGDRFSPNHEYIIFGENDQGWKAGAFIGMQQIQDPYNVHSSTPFIINPDIMGNDTENGGLLDVEDMEDLQIRLGVRYELDPEINFRLDYQFRYELDWTFKAPRVDGDLVIPRATLTYAIQDKECPADLERTYRFDERYDKVALDINPSLRLTYGYELGLFQQGLPPSDDPPGDDDDGGTPLPPGDGDPLPPVDDDNDPPPPGDDGNDPPPGDDDDDNTPPPPAPFDAVDDEFFVSFESTSSLNILGNDVGTIDNVQISNRTSEGGAISLGPNNKVIYTAPDGFSGTDFFDYLITHADGRQDRGFVDIVVAEGPPPIPENFTPFDWSGTDLDAILDEELKLLNPDASCPTAADARFEFLGFNNGQGTLRLNNQTFNFGDAVFFGQPNAQTGEIHIFSGLQDFIVLYMSIVHCVQAQTQATFQPLIVKQGDQDNFEFEIPAPIFADGFESGDVSAWSYTRADFGN